MKIKDPVLVSKTVNAVYIVDVEGKKIEVTLGNCLCSLESRDDGIYWVLDGGEHCDDCVALAAGSPYDSGKDEGT
jgi:hypothetical protein